MQQPSEHNLGSDPYFMPEITVKHNYNTVLTETALEQRYAVHNEGGLDGGGGALVPLVQVPNEFLVREDKARQFSGRPDQMAFVDRRNARSNMRNNRDLMAIAPTQNGMAPDDFRRQMTFAGTFASSVPFQNDVDVPASLTRVGKVFPTQTRREDIMAGALVAWKALDVKEARELRDANGHTVIDPGLTAVDGNVDGLVAATMRYFRGNDREPPSEEVQEFMLEVYLETAALDDAGFGERDAFTVLHAMLNVAQHRRERCLGLALRYTEGYTRSSILLNPFAA